MDRHIIWSDRKRIFCGLPWTFTKYSFSSDRLFIETGLLGKHEDEVRLYRIMDISLSRSFLQRIFGLGNIHCYSADKSMGNFDIVNVKNPRQVKEQLSELVEQQREAKHVVNREFMSHDDTFDDDTAHF